MLSAKYGLVDLDREIDPYEETLNTKDISAVAEWAEKVLVEIRREADVTSDRFTVLAALRYRRFLLPHLAHHDVPLKGLGIGQQLHFLKDRTT